MFSIVSIALLRFVCPPELLFFVLFFHPVSLFVVFFGPRHNFVFVVWFSGLFFFGPALCLIAAVLSFLFLSVSFSFFVFLSFGSRRCCFWFLPPALLFSCYLPRRNCLFVVLAPGIAACLFLCFPPPPLFENKSVCVVPPPPPGVFLAFV